jgi:chemotaxis signal transduction protein
MDTSELMAPREAAQAGLAPEAAMGEQAQAIHCNGLHVAVPYRWARMVVDEFELSPVPNAPIWLAGAANVEGQCVAVIDLGTWAQPQVDQPVTDRNRLLLGGVGDEAFALLFQGLPMMVRESSGQPAAVPARLREFVQASAGEAALPVIDPHALARLWADELSR